MANLPDIPITPFPQGTTSITLKPVLKSRIFSIILFSLAMFFIETKISSEERTIHGPTPICSMFRIVKCQIVVPHTPIRKAKNYLELLIMFSGVLFTVRKMSRECTIGIQTIDISEAVFSRDSISFHTSKVKEFELHESLFERVTGLATMKIYSHDERFPILVITDVSYDNAKAAIEFLKINAIGTVVEEIARRRAS